MASRTLLSAAVAAVLALGFIAGCERSSEETTPVDREVSSPFLFEEYDKTRRPADDLVTAMDRADGRRILLQVGGDWCGWCHAFTELIGNNPDVRREMAKSFVILKVHTSPDTLNSEFLDQYPERKGYPHFYVLEDDGALLHSEGIRNLTDDGAFSSEKVIEFARTWRMADPE